MATGQASTKPPDANEYGGGMSEKNSPHTSCVLTQVTQMRYQPWFLTPVTRLHERALLEKMSPNLLYLHTTASYHRNPRPSMPSSFLATTR